MHRSVRFDWAIVGGLDALKTAAAEDARTTVQPHVFRHLCYVHVFCVCYILYITEFNRIYQMPFWKNTDGLAY